MRTIVAQNHFWEVENLSSYDAGGDTVARSDYPD